MHNPIPPQMALGLFEGLLGWEKENSSKGKMEQSWSFAGLQGGGGILNVESLEELDAIMTSFPLAPFSETEVLPLVEIGPSVERVKQAIRAMVPPS